MISRKNALAGAFDRLGLGRLALEHGSWTGVVGLVHHRLVPHGAPEVPLTSATDRTFAAQLRVLSRSCELVSPGDLSDATLRERGRRVLLTFDDCYRDNYTIAFPALVQHGVPATFFLVSGFADGTASPWWDEIDWMVRSSQRDRLEPSDWWELPLPLGELGAPGTAAALARIYRTCSPERASDFLEHLATATGSGRRPGEVGADDFMTWEMAREMQRAGMVFGAHTDTHPILGNLSEAAQREEIGRSVARLTDELGTRPDLLAYPVGLRGLFDEATKRAAAAMGVRMAFSNYGGHSRPSNWDPLDVRRTPLGTSQSSATFRWTVSLPALFARG